MVNEMGDEVHREAVLTPPLALEGGLMAEHRPPNILQQLIGLFRNVRPGSDVTNFQLPSLFNLPKSQLQCYGESVFCINDDYLSKCSKAETSLERFIAVIAWSISTNRPPIFGLAPFNPILGETHHVSRGSLNVLLEQVSHHPPVSALHATDEMDNIELIWCQYPIPKFLGTKVEATIKGKRELKLLKFNETYEMNSPKLSIRFLPTPSANWFGDVHIQCKETNLEADLCYYKSSSFLGFGGNSRSIKGVIFNSVTRDPICEIFGQWDSTVTVKDLSSGETRIIYDGKQAISELKSPVLQYPKNVWQNESAVVWSEVSQAIMGKDWRRANEAKRNVEERQRKLAKERKDNDEAWIPKHFILSQNKENEWQCSPLQQTVPPGPIVVPL